MDFSRSSYPMKKKSALFNLSSRKWVVGAMSLKSNERSEQSLDIILKTTQENLYQKLLKLIRENPLKFN